MPRFIVKRHQEIKDDLRWRTGVVLYDKNNQATALIRADNRERLIDIQVSGKQKRDYFAVIRGTLNEIHNGFEKLTITELVPLPDNPAYTVSYKQLIGYEKNNRDDYFDGELEKTYSVSELLNGIEKPEQREKSTITNNYYASVEMSEKKIKTKNYTERGNQGDMAGDSFDQNEVKTEQKQAEDSFSYHAQTWEKIIVYLAGFLFMGAIVFLAIRNEIIADKNLAVMLRTLLGLVIAVFGAVVPGMLNVSWKGQGFWIRAGGALALFVLAFFGTPTVF